MLVMHKSKIVSTVWNALSEADKMQWKLKAFKANVESGMLTEEDKEAFLAR